MNNRIDLSTAPSLMEKTAASWSKSGTAQQPKSRKPMPKPQRFAKIEVPEPKRIRLPKKKSSNASVRETHDYKDAQITDKDLEIATRRAVRTMIAELPDPALYIRYLRSWEIQAILEAQQTCDGLFRVQPHWQSNYPSMRRHGLLHFGDDPTLTVFAMRLRRSMKAMGIHILPSGDVEQTKEGEV